MATCTDSGKYIGRRVLVEVNTTLCSDTYPTDNEYQTLGVLTSKDIDFSADTVESVADDIADGFKQTLVTFQNATFTFNGEQVDYDTNLIADLVVFRQEEIAAQRQPGVWLRVTTPALTYTFWVNFTGYTEANPSDAQSTYTSTFIKAPSVLDATVVRTTTA